MKKIFYIMLILSFFAVPMVARAQQISLTDKEAEKIGDRIFRNECGGKDECLITWNKGEDFISLGIGHCIWYPKDKIGPFDESFPKLLKFIKESGKVLPTWLQGPDGQYCPWNSREEFLQNIQSLKVRELRQLLVETKSLQLIFIFNRLNAALPKMLRSSPEALRIHIEEQFHRLTDNPAGIYALTDYVNFSGEGVLATERYSGKGWGLMQVLEHMNGIDGGKEAVREFADTAKDILMERVKNSPPERNEAKWLPGWNKRLDTYIQAFDDLASR